MIPIHHDPHFTFRFADDRMIPRFTLKASRPGSVSRCSRSTLAPASGLDLLVTATVGDGGWVDLPHPIIVRAGDAFIAVPDTAQER